jgi:hypothetical protein
MNPQLYFMKRKLLSLIAALPLLASDIEAADSTNTTSASGASVGTMLNDIAVATGNPSELTNIIGSALNSPDTYNALVRLLKDYLVADNANTNSYLQFIKDFNINFKVFDADAANGNAALGFNYSFERSILGRTINPQSDDPLGLSFAVNAKGNVAFDKTKNPDDFLETGAKFHLFQSIGGWEPALRQQLITKTKPNGEKVEITEAQELIIGLDLSLTEDKRKTDPAWQKFFQFVDQRSRLQFLWDAAGNFSLESNQSFSKKQLAYGFQLGVLVRAWNPDSPWAKWNVLDFPFAAIRYFSRADDEWTPSGQALPSIIAGLDLVDPINDSARFTADPNRGSYPRFRAEIAFKTRVARWKENDLWLSLSYRHFQELSPSAAVRNANLERTDYFAATLDLVYGFNVTYSSGRLPLDRESDRVFGLGWRLNF